MFTMLGRLLTAAAANLLALYVQFVPASGSVKCPGPLTGVVAVRQSDWLALRECMAIMAYEIRVLIHVVC
jgi:hypothetical protein